MRTPQRKPGKYAGVKPNPYITEKKFNQLNNKLERLKNKCPELIEEVKRLALMGDFSENAAYQIAKGRLRGINQGILNIKNQLQNAIIIKPNKNSSIIRLGNKVTIKNNTKLKSYLILGPTETDPANNIISHLSPLGSKLIGKKIGDKVKISTSSIEYEIIAIE